MFGRPLKLGFYGVLKMRTSNRTICRMSPRPRKHLDPRSKRFEIRFAIHLRELMTARRIGPTEFRERLEGAGLEVSIVTVTKWLNGTRLPRPQDAEAIGSILGLKDYRLVWPQ